MTRLEPLVRQSDSAVVRCAREARRAWRAIQTDRRQQKQRRDVLLAREKLITAYLDRNRGPRKLQIGAGNNPLDGWLNADVEPSSDAVMFLEALEVFPFRSEAFDYVFSEHMIEHLPYKGGLFMLQESFRVLKPGGRIRIATPDVERIAGLLTSGKTDAQREYLRWSAMDVLGLYADRQSAIQQHQPEWVIEPAHIGALFPDPGQDCACFVVNHFFRSYGHQFLYDARTLTAALHGAGFVEVAQARPGQSPDPELAGIESHGSVIGEAANAFETMVVEARRP